MRAEAPEGDVRIESDTMGELEVPADRYYGARPPVRCSILTSATTPCRWA